MSLMSAIRLKLGQMPDVVIWRLSQGIAAYTDAQGVERKVRHGMINGAADLIGIVAPHGRLIALEVKEGSGRLSKEQRMFLELVNRMGGIGAEIRSVEEAVEVVEAARVISDRANYSRERALHAEKGVRLGAQEALLGGGSDEENGNRQPRRARKKTPHRDPQR